MLSYFARRVWQGFLVIVVIICLNFFLIHAAPGDPVNALIGTMAPTPEYMEQVRREYGLDEPLLWQFLRYAARMAQFDFGESLRFRQPVIDIILARLPATLLLMGTALVLSSTVGIVLAAAAAKFRDSWVDRVLTTTSIVGFAMPAFWLGQLMLIVFALNLNWLPAQGMYSLRAPSDGFGRVLDILRHLILPALTYSVYHLALIYRLTRVKMHEALAQDYIIAARARGVAEHRVVYVHALRNAILPVVTIIGLNFGFMLAGSVLVETVFAWPGLGRLFYEAISARDYPVLMGIFTLVSGMVVIANILTDMLYAVIDPRVVYG
ncbi:MAG: ABC transporter permease [Rhizobiaceae bacterium]|nr:MAG: ABC transporter permease [Rhizobiaceae bacterium]CAG0986565.1 Dipeptide transport system permease protein DppB [Rhizobiaceae bacterium]